MPEGHNRRMACQIAAQLPDDRAEALRVLAYVRDIVENLGGGWGAETPVSDARLYLVRTSPAESLSGAPADRNGRLDRANPE